MKTYQYPQLGLENLDLVERPEPTPGVREVLIKFRAVSLNYRDLLLAWGRYNPHPTLPTVPCSDGAGEIAAIGAEVTRWKVGDRVSPAFMPEWISGPLQPAYQKRALGGGNVDGVLREFALFSEDALVQIPEHLSFAEAATLPCAAVTAWNALVRVGALKAGETVLTLGTGGVSIFALQLAKLHGARVIATSSSDEKLARVRELGADETINYKTTPAWEKEVRRLTDGRGVDQVVEVGGAGTLPRSLAATRVGGVISLIGVLAEGGGLDPLAVLMKAQRLQGIFVGSREMFEELNRAISVAKLKPIIDRIFPFSEAVDALRYMETGSHFGKIVIEIT